MSEVRILRERQENATAVVDRLRLDDHHGSEAALVQTTSGGSYPTSARSCFICTPLKIDGPETEGAAATFSGDASRTIQAFNLGSRIPPVGTMLIVHSCDGRWTFRYDG